MKADKNLVQEFLAASDRRSFLRRAGLAGMAGAVLPGVASLFTPSSAQAAPTPSPDLDLAILNFALNLEYLEAQYYTYGVQGTSIEAQGVGTTGGNGAASGGTVVKSDSTKVPFETASLQAYMTEIAADERNHVTFLRTALGSAAVAQPKVNLLDSFNSLAQLAGLGDSFDPFADELSFLLGAFIFEDVGVTAYHGAAPLIFNKAYLAPAAGILAVEAYHAATIRTLLYNLNQQTTTSEPMPNAGGATPPPPSQDMTIADMVQAISNARDSVDNPKKPSKDRDQGIVNADGSANIVPTNASSIAYMRDTVQVLRIVYGSTTKPPTPGLFFPNGMNGVIK